MEIGQREDQLDPLHILIMYDVGSCDPVSCGLLTAGGCSGERQADIDRARPLCEDLLATVKAELDAAKTVPALTPYGAVCLPPGSWT